METNGLRMALNSDDAPRMRRGRLRGPVRAALWALGCVVFAFWAPASAEPKPRTTLVLYPYHGIGGVDVSALGADLEVYLADKLRNLYANFATHPSAGYMADLRIEKLGVRPATAAELSAEWRRLKALLLMDGVIVPADGTHLAKSSIYLGDLGRHAPGKSAELIHVDLPLRGEEYGSIADSHSVATLFGLALDARDNGLPKDLYVRLAARALEIVDPLAAGPAPAPDLKRLRCGLLTFMAEATDTPVMDEDC